VPDQTPTAAALLERLSVEQGTNGRLATALLRITKTAGRKELLDATRAELLAELDHTRQLAGAAFDGVVADVQHEYEVLWHGDGDDNTILMSEAKIGYLSRALRRGPERVGEYGIIRFTVDYCVHVKFAEGSTWISGWQPVDYRGVLTPCPACAATVFRASTTDTAFLLDANPVPDGDLVLVPNVVHGGEPGAVYGADLRPGIRRYHQHDCPQEGPTHA
jgi:hypothetical protein